MRDVSLARWSIQEIYIFFMFMIREQKMTLILSTKSAAIINIINTNELFCKDIFMIKPPV